MLTKTHFFFVLMKAFVKVANITFNHNSFAAKESHMVMYEDEIYDQWINILEKHQASAARGRQPSITTFRCLRGLQDADVQLLQRELIEGKIFLLKHPQQQEVLDLFTRATNLKQTKIFVVEMLKLFKEINPLADINSWEDCRSHYNITDDIYKSLFASCVQWLQVKLQQTKETPAFPEVTKGYVHWIIAQKIGISTLQIDLPWKIKGVGKNLEGIEFLSGEKSSKVRVGVCIIDTTHQNMIPSGWSAQQFGKVIDGVCGIAQPSEFVIVGLVKYQHAASLEKAISEKAKWYEMHALPLGSLISSEAVRTTSLRNLQFGVWAFFSQGEQYSNYSSVTESLLQPMSSLCVDEEEFDAMVMAKAFFVRRAIKCVCVKEDDQVIDVFSLGYGTREALQQQRRVISLACTNEQMTQLEALCNATVDEDVELRKWAGLDAKDKVNVSSAQENNGEEIEEEEFIEPLDASADAILESLQETG